MIWFHCSSQALFCYCFVIFLFDQCRSHRNRSWPIQSSFFQGADYQGKSSWRPSWGHPAGVAAGATPIGSTALGADMMAEPDALAGHRPINFGTKHASYI